MVHALKSPSCEGNTAGRSLPLYIKQKIRNNYTKRKQAKTAAKLELSLINQIYTKYIGINPHTPCIWTNTDRRSRYLSELFYDIIPKRSL